MMIKLTTLVVVFMKFSLSVAQVTQSSYTGHSDEELHQNQIPPPNMQPSEDEVKRAILLLVEQKIDQNSDQKLSPEELSSWLAVVHKRIIDDNVDRQWLFYEPTQQEVHSWEGYAPETKEVLHWEAFKAAAYPAEYLKEDPENPNDDSIKKMLTRSERRWQQADLNSDSVLTKDEFKGFVHPEEVEKLQHILVDEALEDMDADNDTIVTLEEYFNHLKTVTEDEERNDPSWKTTHENHFKEYLDVNKDGQLDRDEVKDWIIPKYNRHDAEAYRLITHADEDKDNELSRDEIQKHFQHFYSVLPPEFWNQFAPDEQPQKHDEL